MKFEMDFWKQINVNKSFCSILTFKISTCQRNSTVHVTMLTKWYLYWADKFSEPCLKFCH